MAPPFFIKKMKSQEHSTTIDQESTVRANTKQHNKKHPTPETFPFCKVNDCRVKLPPLFTLKNMPLVDATRTAPLP